MAMHAVDAATLGYRHVQESRGLGQCRKSWQPQRQPAIPREHSRPHYTIGICAPPMFN